MLRRFLAGLVALACLLSAFALAEGESYSMRVIKCSTRVNIRQYPNTNSAIVGQAPLGATLVGCQIAAKGSDWYAVVYEGVAGYIRGDFLEQLDAAAAPAPAEEAPAPVEEAPAPAEEAPAPAEPAPDLTSDQVAEYDPAQEVVEEPAAEPEAPAAEPVPVVVDEPIVVDVSLEEASAEPETPAEPEAPAEEAPAAPAEEAPAEPVAAEPAAALPAVENAPISGIADAVEAGTDELLIDTDASGVHVVARHIVGDNREYVMVAGLDAEGNALWKQETATSGVTVLTLTDAFMGGIAARPLVMLYNAEVGLCAIDPTNGAIRWLLTKDDISLGASVSHAVAGNGVLFIGGYYGPDPVAIDANGRVLWRASSGSDDIYWLYNIELTSDSLICAYDNIGSDGASGSVIYGYNGAVKEIVTE